MPDPSTPDTPPSLGHGPAALRAVADRYDGILAKAPTGDDPRYYQGVHDVIHGLRLIATEAERAADDGGEQRGTAQLTTEDKAAAAGLTGIEYRYQSHRAAVAAVRAALPGMYAQMAFRVQDALAEELEAPPLETPDAQPTPDRTAELAATLREVLTHFGPMHDQVGGPVTYYDGFAGVEPKAYDRWRATLDGVPGALDPTEADDPTPLRWGLHDVLWGDDDTVTICLSGPTGEPYWLELGPDRADVLREDLAGPPTGTAPATDQEPVELRWGLNDVTWGDDLAITVALSGPAGEPYRLELDTELAAELREGLKGPHD